MRRESLNIDPSYVNLIDSDTYLGPFKKKDRIDVEVPLRIKQHMRVGNFFDRLSEINGGVMNEVLPRNCRYARRDANGNTTYVIEHEPAIRTMVIDFSLEKDKAELMKNGMWNKFNVKELMENSKMPNSRGGYRLNLALPYIIYVVTLNNNHYPAGLKVYFRLHELSSLGDQLFYNNFSNANRDQNFCLGGSVNEKKMRSDADGIEENISRFWYNGFNSDYIYNVKRYKEANVPYVSNYLEWAVMSMQDPLFIYDVPWILFPKNLNTVISDMCVPGGQSLSYEKLKTLFQVPAKTEVKSEKTKRTSTYIENCTSQLYLGDNVTIELGEIFEYKGKKYAADSFIGNQEYTVKFIRTEDEEGKFHDLPVTSSVLSELLDAAKKAMEMTSITVGKEEIKVNDAVKYSISSDPTQIQIGKVTSLRQRREGVVEIIIGTVAYILNNIIIRPVDISKITINGLPVSKGMKFYYRANSTGSSRKSMSDIYYIAEYDTFRTSMGNPTVMFKYVSHSDGSISTLKIPVNNSMGMDDDTVEIKTDLLTPIDSLDMSTTTQLPMYHQFHKLFTPLESNPHYLMNGIVGVLKFQADAGYPSSTIYNTTMALNKLLNKDGTELYIPGLVHDVHFVAGDQVLHANWSEPADMLRLKTISGFVYNEEQGRISIIVFNNDEPEKLITIPYIDTNYGIALVGKIRKVDIAYPGMTAGYKVRCKLPYIPAFPKKDINEVVGVLETPGDDPLVLFTNYTTLPLSYVKSSFSIYTPKSSYYKKLVNAVVENPATKYKPQPADMFVMPGVSRSDFNTMIWTGIRQKDGYENWKRYLCTLKNTSIVEEYDKSSLRRCHKFGFLAPRISAADQVENDGKRYFPDMYGGIIDDETSYLCL